MATKPVDTEDDLEQVQDNEQSGGDDLDHSEDTARMLGWKPKEEYKGDPEQWRDWEDFLDTEKRNGPQIRAENKLLKRRLVSLEKKFSRDLEDAKKHFSRVEERAFERAVKELRDKQRQAVANADEEAFDEAQAEIDALTKEAAPVNDGKVAPEVQKAFIKWERENDWYRESGVMRAAADAICEELGPYFETGMDPDEYLEEVTARVKKEFPHKFAQPKKRSAVEGVPDGRSGSRSAETFDNMPADAKAQFERFKGMGLPVTKEGYAKDYWTENKRGR